MSGASVLELDGVTKVYGDDPPVPVLRGVSFSVRRGELVAIVGPSGSGKSTLLHVIGTLERPSSGVVRIGGVDAAQLDDRELSQLRAREIGFVFQQFFLAEHATVRENVAIGAMNGSLPARKSVTVTLSVRHTRTSEVSIGNPSPDCQRLTSPFETRRMRDSPLMRPPERRAVQLAKELATLPACGVSIVEAAASMPPTRTVESSAAVISLARVEGLSSKWRTMRWKSES